jgi:hypothetical protein
MQLYKSPRYFSGGFFLDHKSGKAYRAVSTMLTAVWKKNKQRRKFLKIIKSEKRENGIYVCLTDSDFFGF